MTRQEFEWEVRRTQLYASTLIMLSVTILPGLFALLLWWTGDLLRPPQAIWQELLFVLLLIAAVALPGWWVLRRFPIPCPTCGRALANKFPTVLETGKCSHCHVVLFAPPEPDPDLPAKRRHTRRFVFVALAIGLVIHYSAWIPLKYMDWLPDHMGWPGVVIVPAFLWGVVAAAFSIIFWQEARSDRSEKRR